MNKNDGGPAYPLAFEDGIGKDVYAQYGMSLRDYFAAHAPFTMADAIEVLVKSGNGMCTGPEVIHMLTYMRYNYANQMLKAKEQINE